MRPLLPGLLAATAWSGAAQAQDLVSRETFAGVVDVRAYAADGEESWVDDAYGKARYGDGAGLDLGEATLAWRPRLNWEWDATVVAQVQPDQTNGVDLGEAFVSYRPVPRGPVRLRMRAGLYYPEISLEHEGPGWTLVDTLTPSAINSWVGEEVKVAGAEATVSGELDGGRTLSATAGGFWLGDTAGTLLTFRGWAMHDLRSTAFGRFPLPPLSPFMATKQPRFTTSLLELDDNIGWYARAEWTSGPVRLNALYYDNMGDLISVNSDKEWSWDTRFWALGADVWVSDRTRLRAQAVSGVTLMGYATPEVWIDVEYRAAYLMLTHTLGDGAVSGRLDVFETEDNTWQAIDPNQEDGWALTAAWRHPLRDRLDLVLEALHIESDRPSRVTAGVSPEQSQTVVQSALRFRF